MKIEVDRGSGFCFGVIKAIKMAEAELKNEDFLYCLGDIVHNGMEVHRLERMGLKSISREEYFNLSHSKVLIRAHGEPPETYEYAKRNNIELVDATCPVVLTLQEKIKASYQKSRKNKGQIVIFGKKGHAEIIGLDGQTNQNAILVESVGDIENIDFSRPVWLYSQTTRRIEDFNRITSLVKSKMKPGVRVEIKDTICRQVSNRVPHLKSFVVNYDLILFVAGYKSSNGKYLFAICKEENPNSYHVSRPSEINPDWFKDVNSVGICGATSTPYWVMEEVASQVKKMFR
jgi:4-hydroxy-3-methylbut-2-en-1-yl diphosphate reductase